MSKRKWTEPNGVPVLVSPSLTLPARKTAPFLPVFTRSVSDGALRTRTVWE